jgi:putative ABC transport system ATP-binding protein
LAEEVLSLTDVGKDYRNGETVLKSVTVTVSQGEFVGIHGRSGSGKSTLLRIMGLLDKPTHGKAVVLGRDVATLGDSESARMRREQLGFVFQGFNLIPHITARENIEIPMWLVGVKGKVREERALAQLKLFGMQRLADRYPKELSHGEQQRVAALRALVNRPRLILADEPTSSLDDDNAKTFLDLVLRFNKEFGATIVMTSTDPGETKVAAVAYRLANGALTREM